MAIYHCSIKNISRSDGKSAVASASYRAGEKLHDEELDKSFDYTRKENVVHKEIILCDNAPSAYADRATLWNAVQKVESVSDARLAREFEIAFPEEWSQEQCIEYGREFCKSLAKEGMCVDWAIHWKEGNHHFHAMATTRPIKENGEWGNKEKKAYKLDENEQRIPIMDAKTGEQKVDSRNRKQWERVLVESTDWNKREKVQEWRERWETIANEHLSEKDKINCLSYEKQGLDILPTIHEGYAAREMEKRGEVADRCELNREIRAVNEEIEKAKQGLLEIPSLKAQIATLKAILEQRIQNTVQSVKTALKAPTRVSAPKLDQSTIEWAENRYTLAKSYTSQIKDKQSQLDAEERKFFKNAKRIADLEEDIADLKELRADVYVEVSKKVGRTIEKSKDIKELLKGNGWSDEWQPSRNKGVKVKDEREIAQEKRENWEVMKQFAKSEMERQKALPTPTKNLKKDIRDSR